MSFLLDTNVISELQKGPRCHTGVARWWASVDAASVFTSVLVIAEMRRGVDRLRARDPDRARVLEAWLADIKRRFGERILPVDADAAEEWGRLDAIRTTPIIDGLMAASAKVRGLTFVTRNITDVGDLGVSTFNPFQAG